MAKKPGLINDPNTIHFFIARAETQEEWERVNRMVHDRLDAAIERGELDGIDLDSDENIANLNSIAALTHEIVSMRNLASKILDHKKR
jgi:hypothetical protein